MADIAFIGFGEAGQALATGLPSVRAFDRRTDDPACRADMLADYRRLGVAGCRTNAAAVGGAAAVLSLVTAGQALAAAQETARALAPGALFLDMNSVAPDTKRAAARVVEAAGGRYADVAVMAPVLPRHRATPLLVSGPHADAAQAFLGGIGFTAVRVQAGPVGAASAVKMVRSIMVKGLEALGAECALAAQAAGVLDEVVASLDASWPDASWAERLDYGLDRMLTHGVRRAEEMGEVVATLESLGVAPAMSRAAADRQHALGELRLKVPGGLPAKLAALGPTRKQDAA